MNIPTLYMVRHNGNVCGPYDIERLLHMCESGVYGPDTQVWRRTKPQDKMSMSDLIDFGDTAGEEVPDYPREESHENNTDRQRFLAEEVPVHIGDNFKCPYCRAVSDIGDVLSVSVSSSLLGDAVLGDSEQKRFLPSHFTSNGLAIDSEGGICTEIACPRCHMALPRALLETPQVVMSVIGAAGAGKSVFLASSMWQCRQMLSSMFGVRFMDLDPVANMWINAYEEKLFFQNDDTTLQQIEKTDLQASNITRSVMLDGDSMLLPLPSFFRLQKDGDQTAYSLVVYDSAGEHFRAGADTHSSSVTLNMLGADSLFFMFDPSADPRFRSILNFGEGTAHNYAQRQDSLVVELAARIRRHLGNRSLAKLSCPFIFGVAKADLLREYLPLETDLYCLRNSGFYCLNMDALREVSAATERVVCAIAPELVATVHDIADETWFLPVSSLGHNPMREGVRPCDIRPIWTELPVVLTLAKIGLIPMVSASGQ